MLVAEVCEHSDDFVNGFHFKTRIEGYLCDVAHKNSTPAPPVTQSSQGENFLVTFRSLSTSSRGCGY